MTELASQAMQMIIDVSTVVAPLAVVMCVINVIVNMFLKFIKGDRV